MATVGGTCTKRGGRIRIFRGDWYLVKVTISTGYGSIGEFGEVGFGDD